MKPQDTSACPCGGGNYADCCGRYHHGALPDTAEQLMRSRYSAYVLGLTEYVHASWHPTTRPAIEELALDTRGNWLGLEVRRHVPGQSEASVEFVARHKTGGRAQRLHELSRFVKEDGKWLYLDGSMLGLNKSGS